MQWTLLDAIEDPGARRRAEFADAEGLAFYDGYDLASDPPTFCIRHGSIQKWNMGATHEILHLLGRELGALADKKFEATYEAFQGKPVDTAEHLFVFLAQYYIAGFDGIVKELAPEVHALCDDLIGPARVAPRTTSVSEARRRIQTIVRGYKTGH